MATAALVLALLFLGRPVLMPIAAAAALAFILSSPVKWLERRISRIPALALVMLLAAGTLGSAAYVVATELNDLTMQIGKYTESMRRKVAALQGGGSGPLGRVEVMFARITDGLEKRVEPDAIAVRVVPARTSRGAHAWNLVKPLAEPLVTVLFVLVLCVFMLGGRDDLRNRLISLIGTGNVTFTTHALDEGARRVTRYLRDQAMINAIFGAVVGTGLYFIGIPYAVLWGIVAALARFVPYVGAISSMVMPVVLAFAVFPGWSPAILTMGLFVGMDLVTANAIEPLLIGRRTGISPVALLVSAFFWGWIWGPMGLVLATPITVSLAVLGRHVAGLRFLAVLLGDDPVIGAEISFYQRLLARDEDGAGEIARTQQVDLGSAGVVDQIIVPTLILAARDVGRQRITAEDQSLILTWSRDVFLHLSRGSSKGEVSSPIHILGVAAHRTESEFLLEMLAAELPPEAGELEILPSTATLPEVVARVERVSPGVVCVAALPPEGGPHARRACQGLKARFPGLTVMVFRPGEPGADPARIAARLHEAGADLVVATVAEASAQLSRLVHGR
jgi:predicted PurR-regulated permease PerM